ncbi:MAG: LuxR C-terminal-related transcriptional regulator [Mangrovibacterium sp.]
MKTALFILTFFLTAGLSGLGIITAYRLKSNPKYRFASTLFYLCVFLCAFGFYGIWGNLLVNFLFKPVISSHLLINLMSILPILGIPLLIVSWFLMINFSIEISGRKIGSWWSAGYFLICIAGLFLVVAHLKNKLAVQSPIDKDLLYEVLIIFHLVFICLSTAIVLQSKQKPSFQHQAWLIFMAFFIPLSLFASALFMSSSHWLYEILAILFFFSQVAVLPAILYFRLGDFEVRQTNTDSFSTFCQLYEISKREAEIIEQICQGKTNKEISESLFITLQTVKDHASRIYLKTGAGNRVQLTNLVRTKMKSGSG